MTVRELIQELLKVKDLDKTVTIYSLVDMENIDTSLSQFELTANKIIEIDNNSLNNTVYICGDY